MHRLGKTVALPEDFRKLGAMQGTVQDPGIGERFASAWSSIHATQLRTVSGANGRYLFVGFSPGGYTPVIHRLGYQPLIKRVTLPDTGVTRVDLTLQDSEALLDKVVTTATGADYAAQVGNALANVQADSIVAKTGVSNLSDILTARVPSVQVFDNGGLVGSSPQINMRGQNSAFFLDQPLLYIDGVRGANSTAGASRRFNDVSPDDIESVEVIKGPVASALYGTDAVEGIVWVHTKRGMRCFLSGGYSEQGGYLQLPGSDHLAVSKRVGAGVVAG